MGILILAILAAQDDPKFEPGKFIVKAKKAYFYSEPVSGDETKILRKAKYGEAFEVEKKVMAGKVPWVQGKIDGDKTALITLSAVLPEKEFKEKVEGSEESGSSQAEAYRGSRFDPETEKKYQEKLNLTDAYKKVDFWCGCPEVREQGRVVKESSPGKPAWQNDRIEMLRILRQFRRDGKLGEYGEKH